MSALRRVADGGSALDRLVVQQLLYASGRTTRCAKLRPREREVLELMAAGSSNQGIAEKLVITVGVVEKYVSSISSRSSRCRAPEPSPGACSRC